MNIQLLNYCSNNFFQVISQQFKRRLNDYSISALFSSIVVCLLLLDPLYATNFIDNRESEYTNFWSDYENVFVYRPSLVKQTFYNIISLKGKSTVARNHINSEILGCKPDSPTHSICRIDKLIRLKKKWQVKRYFEIPVNYSIVSIRKYFADKQKRILTISWQPALFQPPNIEVEKFLEYVGAAKDSPYYTVIPELKRIQYNPIFQKKVEIVVSTVIANNIFSLYQTPLTDYRDSLTFYLDSSSTDFRYQTRYINLNLKIKHLKINHQVFKVLKDRFL